MRQVPDLSRILALRCGFPSVARARRSQGSLPQPILGPSHVVNFREALALMGEGAAATGGEPVDRAGPRVSAPPAVVRRQRATPAAPPTQHRLACSTAPA